MSQPKLAVTITISQSWCNKVSADGCHPSWFLVTENKIRNHLYVRNLIKEWVIFLFYWEHPEIPPGENGLGLHKKMYEDTYLAQIVGELWICTRCIHPKASSSS